MALFGWVTVLTLSMLLAAAAPSRSQGASADTTGQSVSQPGATQATLDTTVEAGEADASGPKRKLVKWNEFDGPVSTLRIGYGFLVDFNGFSQDEEAKELKTATNDVGLRDFRLLFKGRFKTKRPISWTLGYMYDGAADDWRFRMTGFMIGVPELSGSFFIGRTKEGYSLNKVMVGYDGWTIERYTANDAFIPILADGVKWLGYAKKPRVFWNLGWYADGISEDESFSTYDHQTVLRLGWQPVLSDASRKVLHLAVMGRDAKPDEGKFQAKSRPEAYLSPFFVDTGKFDTDHMNSYGVEAYYRSGPWMLGTEYNWHKFDAPTAGDPLFNGGDVSLIWNITGETRAYNEAQGFFKAVSPAKSLFQGGPGAWEAVLRFSYIDLDAGNLRGGKFWRITPMVNWHASDNLRFDLGYGVGVLEKADLKGTTQFFQLRIQTLL